jgi:hypothetical protein
LPVRKGHKKVQRNLTHEAIRVVIYSTVAEVTIASYSFIQVGKRKLLSKAEMLIIAYVNFHCRERSTTEAGIVPVKRWSMLEQFEQNLRSE